MGGDLDRPGFLAIAERGIGDALTMVPSLRALRAAHPELRVELLAPGLFPLAANLRDAATILDHRPLTGLSADQRLAWLRDRNTTWVWNTEAEAGAWSRALPLAGRPTWITAPTQRHWRGQVVQVRFEQLRGLFPDLRTVGGMDLSLTADQETVRRGLRMPGSTVIAIQPGAGAPGKLWPAEKFSELIIALTQRESVVVLLFLSGEEPQFSASGFLPVRDNLRLVQLPLADALPVLASADLFIGNDSGFAHLAFALGLRSVVIFRSLASARRWGHRGARARALFPYVPKPFRGEWSRWVSVRRVLRSVRRLLPGV
ncbi:MAG TPA: glycosyltransferase family 9 protein [Gemmatimonadales bacterium]|nr:glycosyltransferase family 9 protein [Gemmatimonadales bacterium]